MMCNSAWAKVPFMPSTRPSLKSAGSYTPSSSITTVPVIAHSSSRRCQSWFERASLDASRAEDRADLAHRHVADQGLEVGAGACGSARLAEIAIENPDLLLAPTRVTGPCSPGCTGDPCSPD